MRAEIALTDGEIEARFEEIGAGASVREITFTRDTIQEWLQARQDWLEWGRVLRSPPGTLVIERARVNGELPQMSFYIVDFGRVRGVYSY